MDDHSLSRITHPMGEGPNRESIPSKTQDIQCDTFAGLVHVEWDDQEPSRLLDSWYFFRNF